MCSACIHFYVVFAQLGSNLHAFLRGIRAAGLQKVVFVRGPRLIVFSLQAFLRGIRAAGLQKVVRFTRDASNSVCLHAFLQCFRSWLVRRAWDALGAPGCILGAGWFPS